MKKWHIALGTIALAAIPAGYFLPSILSPPRLSSLVQVSAPATSDDTEYAKFFEQYTRVQFDQEQRRVNTLGSILALNGTVKITNSDNLQGVTLDNGRGSGVLHQGHILTVDHLVNSIFEGVPKSEFADIFGNFKQTGQELYLDQKKTVEVKRDPKNDAAIYRLPPELKTMYPESNKLEIMPLEKINPGQEVYWWANPGSQGAFFFVKGSVSAKVSVKTGSPEIKKEMICFDVDTDRGTSGTGVFDYTTHNLIGIISRTVGPESGLEMKRVCAVPIDVYTKMAPSLFK